MRPNRFRYAAGRVLALSLPCAAALLAFSVAGRSQGPAVNDAGPPRGEGPPTEPAQPHRLDVARYDPEGKLEFPDGAERWIGIGAGIGSDYDEAGLDPADPGPIGVAQIEPAAYDYFRTHGRYADGTMLLLTFYAVQEKPEPALNGFVQGEPLQREIHVIDRERFPEEGRAFFMFPGSGSAAAEPLPVGSTCVECHTEHGRLDGTFVQFYPPLR